MTNRMFLAVALLCAAAAPAAAQRNEATLEASVLRGAIGYARAATPRVLAGIEVGFGFPQIDRTLQPAKDAETGSPSFEEYLHIGVFVRLKASDAFEVDTGLRGSVVDLWPCAASDCWPPLFGGAYVQPMIGGRRIKVGARLTTGIVSEGRRAGVSGPVGGDGSTFVVGLNPFIVRATLPW